MFHVLVVEDMPDSREGVVSFLLSKYKGWKIDEAGSIQEAIASIDGAIRDGTIFDVLVLDFLLPERLGSHPEGSVRLTEYALEALPDALIIQMTAFEDDAELREKLVRPQLLDPNRRIIFLAKTEHYTNKIANAALKRVIGDPIEDRLDDVFGPEDPHRSGRRTNSSALEQGLSLTHRLADLRGRIAESWEYLAPELQSRIERKFKVDSTTKPIRVTMF